MFIRGRKLHLLKCLYKESIHAELPIYLDEINPLLPSLIQKTTAKSGARIREC